MNYGSKNAFIFDVLLLRPPWPRLAGRNHSTVASLAYFPAIQRIFGDGFRPFRKSSMEPSTSGDLIYLYFLRSQNVVKVGIASDFASRLDAIRRGNFHHPIEFCGVTGTGARNI